MSYGFCGSLYCVALLAGASSASVALAQAPVPNTPAAEAAVTSGAAEDIVVTARRRDESAQTVPVSLIALGAQALEERQVRSLYDLTSTTPGIRFVAQGGSGNMNVVMRGLSKAPAGDSPNAVISYFGDTPLYFWGSDIPTFDLQSVQVLKGPQGTLFGRNSIGGAVVVTPQAPTMDLAGYARGQIGNYDLRDIEGVVNLPIVTDKVALRVGAKISRRDGYVDIVNQDSKGFDNIHRDAFRASLLLQPTDWLKNTTVGDYMKAEEVGTNALIFAALPTGVSRLFPAFFDCGTSPSCDIDLALERQNRLGKGKVYTWREPFVDRTIWGVQNRTEVDIGSVQFRNILGYRETKLITHNETQGNDFFPPLLASDSQVRIKQFSEEAQLIGQLFDSRIDWIVGYFHISEDPYGENAVRVNIINPNAPWIHGFNYRKSDAVFGQVGVKLVEGVKLNAGYRHTWDRSRVCSGSSPTNPARPTDFVDIDETECDSLNNANTIRYKGDDPTYTIGLDWQVTDQIFAYISHRRGYRQGGVNTPAFVSPGTTGGVQPNCPLPGGQCIDLQPYQSYGAEKLTDVEIGIKTDFRLADVPVRLNLSAYRSNYSNVQTSFNVANLLPPGLLDAPQNNALIINSGSRRFTGFEGELAIRPTGTLTLGGNVAYVKQKVTDNQVPTTLPGLIPPLIVNLSPKWSTSLNGRWQLPIDPAGGKVVLTADYYYQSSFFVGNGYFPSYDVTNARLEWSDIGDTGIAVAGFVRNIFDNRYRDAAGATSASLGFLSAHYSEPRIYGLELTFRFGG